MRKKLHELYDVYVREFKLTFHDGGILLFFIFLPFAYPVLYSLIYNPEVVRDVRMVVVDHDRTALSRDLVRRLDACQEVWITGYATDLDEARHAMNSHHCYGILEIPEGLERKVGRTEQAQVILYSDMSLMLRYKAFLVAATNVAQSLGADILAERVDAVAPLAGTVAVEDPMPMDSIQLGNTVGGFDSFIMPGIVVLILHQCLILASCMAGGARRERPSMIGYNPDNEAPSTLMTMAGQMLCYFTIIFVPAIFLYHYVPLILAFPMAGNVMTMMIFLLPMALACLGVGFIIQGFVGERETVFIYWVVTSVMFLFLSGLTWPRYAMHGFWHFLSDIVPATWAVEGFIRINTNGASLAQVREEYLMLWLLAAVYLGIAYAVHRFKLGPELRRLAARREQ